MTQQAVSATRQRHLRAIQKEREDLQEALELRLEFDWDARYSYLGCNIIVKLQTLYALYLASSLTEHETNVERYYLEPMSFSTFLMEHRPCMLDIQEARALLASFDVLDDCDELEINQEFDWVEMFTYLCELLADIPQLEPVLKLLPRPIVMNDDEFPLQITFDW